MNLDDALLQKLESLTMLKIDPQKREEIKKQLSDILNFIENVSQVDTQKITLENTQSTPLREDVVFTDDEIVHKVLQHAPKSQSNFFIVPKIIE